MYFDHQSPTSFVRSYIGYDADRSIFVYYTTTERTKSNFRRANDNFFRVFNHTPSLQLELRFISSRVFVGTTYANFKRKNRKTSRPKITTVECTTRET